MATYSAKFQTSEAAELILEITTASYSVENNNSVLNCVLKLKKLKNYASWNAGGSANINMVVNGTTLYSANTFDIRSMAIGDVATYATKTITISHNADGNKSVAVSAYFYSNTSLGTGSVSGTFTCVSIPRQANLTAAPHFNDEENPTITYSNPAGNAVTSLQACISLTGAIDDIKYRDIDKTGTSYTFQLTEEERNILRNATLDNSTQRIVRFFVRTNIGGTLYHSSLRRTLTITNCNPTIAPTYYDENATTVALTGNSSIFVKGYSNLKYNMNAAGKKGSSIVEYWAKCGSKTSSKASDTLYNIDGNTITFAARDNRNINAQKIDTPLTVINYISVTCNRSVEIELVGETGAKIEVTLNGNYFNGSFGKVFNELFLEYRYKAEDGAYSNWIPVTEAYTPTFRNNTYSLTFQIENLDYDKAYTIQAKARDKLTNATAPDYIAKLIPVFDWSKTDFNFNVPVNIMGYPVKPTQLNSMSEVDNFHHSDGQLHIGYGVFDNNDGYRQAGYLCFGISWIDLQFRITSWNNAVWKRVKYGNNAWSEWTEI